MHKCFLLIAVGLFATCGLVLAKEPQAQPPESELTDATFLVTGLHCPPCATVIERSLAKENGVKSITVDWKTKQAHAAFDEKKLSAQEIANLIGRTPHMMGGKLRYAGWLALNVKELDDTSEEKVSELLGKIEGVKRVVPYPKQHVVGIQFSERGRLTDRQLIDTLSHAGYHVKNL